MDRTAIRNRLRDDLRKLFSGTIHSDYLHLRMYASDASLFQLEPLAVAEPRNTADIQLLVRYAREHQLTIIPRGAGTGLAGEAIGNGIILDCSVHLRQILEVNGEFVRVQPGVTLDDLNQHLKPFGRRFPIDPASGNVCTIGGMWATNASGSRANLHGSTRDHVHLLEPVWDDATIGMESPRALAIYQELAEFTTRTGNINSQRHRFDHAGYFVSTPMTENLTPTLVGSEGTLAIFSEGTLKTIPLAGGVSAAMLTFASLEQALDIGLLMQEHRPAACELLDRRLIGLARLQSEEAAKLISADTEAIIILEFEGDSPPIARQRLNQLLADLSERSGTPIPVLTAENTGDIERLWNIRRRAIPTMLNRIPGPRPLPGIEDIGVHPSRLPELWAKAKTIFRKRDVLVTTIAHVATGQVHFRPLLDPENPSDVAKLFPLADELYSVVLDLDGTISAQHGIGLARTPWMEKQLQDRYASQREIKNIFDPMGMFNPGKFSNTDPSRPAWPIQQPTQIPEAKQPLSLLVWQPEEQSGLVHSCNSCGKCRTEQPNERMCPIYRVTHQEDASPRAKMQLLREAMLNPEINFNDHEMKPIADLCVNCRMCAVECPSQADIPKLMLEIKAAQHERHGLTRSDWMLARIDGLTRIAARFSITANLLMRQPIVRWLLEKTLGLSRKRTLPSLKFWTFMGNARREGWTKSLEPGVKGYAYFADTFANLFDPTVAEASVRVLKHQGLPVIVPAGQIGSGAAALAHGDLDIARERLRKNTRILADAVRQGHRIVCSEPTAALFFRFDALNLSDTPEVKLLADNTVELTTLLGELHDAGKLRTDFKPLAISLGHHIPCHIKALPGRPRGPELLRLIPELRVNTIDVSCSGMAGVFGLLQDNYETSLQAGKPMLDEFNRPSHLYGSSECSSCRLQMQEGTGKRALHPVQYLALAYGLMPELTTRLRKPWKNRVSS